MEWKRNGNGMESKCKRKENINGNGMEMEW